MSKHLFWYLAAAAVVVLVLSHKSEATTGGGASTVSAPSGKEQGWGVAGDPTASGTYKYYFYFTDSGGNSWTAKPDATGSLDPATITKGN